jgi:hypothetical protein
MDLQALYLDTCASLAGVWDDLGVPSEERARLLGAVAEDIAGVLRGRVAGQEARRAGVLDEVASLGSTIVNMQHAMEEPETVVRPPRGSAEARR